MVNSDQEALPYRKSKSSGHPATDNRGRNVSRPWRQWHSAAQVHNTVPLEVAAPRKPQWGRYIYLLIIFSVVAFVGREIYHGLFWFNAQGSFSGRQYKVAPSQTVTISEVFVSPSDRVAEGQPLVKFKSAELEQELARNDAEIARIQADIVETNAQMRNNRETLRSDIAGYRARLEALKQRSDNEVEKIDALRRLVASGAASKGSLQELEIEHAETWSEYTQVKAQLESAYNQSSNYAYEGMNSDIQAPEQRLASLKNLREKIQEQMANLELKAPASGVVANVPVSRGDVVRPGEAALTLVERDDKRAYLYFPPSAQESLKVGQILDGRTANGNAIPLRITKIYPSIADGRDSDAINVPDDASLVVEAEPTDGKSIPLALSSGTPIYARVPRWSISRDIEQRLTTFRKSTTNSDAATQTGTVGDQQSNTSLDAPAG